MRVSVPPPEFWRDGDGTSKSNSAKILVAEDDVLIALSLQQTLSLFGFEVVGIAATVSDALCLAQNTRPDLAIFDIQTGRQAGRH
jgi:DNA-binding response OmpR family regulator